MVKTNDKVADAAKSHWVYHLLPRFARPYAQLARFDRPIGWWLLFLPCLWSLSLAHIHHQETAFPYFYAFLFFIGCVVMRGAGCTYNDIIDRNIDGKIERTRSRPIPSGRISSKKAALFMLFQCFVGLIVLLQFNMFSILLGVSSLAIVAVYPFMKRITYWPQIVLGFAFSWGALMGWSSLEGSLSLAPLFLYLGTVLWTIGYDTIYAHQDREDDALVGVKSTALLLGEKTGIWLIGFYSSATLLFVMALFSSGAGLPAYIGLALGGLHMFYQTLMLDIENGEQCLKLFRSNRGYGLIFFAGLFWDGFF